MQENISRRYLWISYILISVSGFFAVFSDVLGGEDPGVIISEIFYDASGSDVGKEWIEVVNLSDESFDLEGWKFFEGGVNHGLKLYQGEFSLGSNERVAIMDDPAEFLLMYPGYSGSLIESSFSLKNTGELLALRDNAGNIVYEMDYVSYVSDVVSGFSLELRDDDVWSRSCVLGGTPGKENCQKDEEVVINIDLKLTELFPDPEASPESSYEFIEVYNFSDEEIDLQGWTVRDESGEKSLNGNVDANGYEALYKTVSLNNGGDVISLVAPNGEVVDAVSYGDAQRGWSWSWEVEDWKWTPHVTPDKKNEFIQAVEGVGVRFNEIYANPEDEKDEYIELYNNGNKSIDLRWWSLSDASKNGMYTIGEELLIIPGSYVVIFRDVFGFSLNNSHETVYLKEPGGEIVDEFSYESTKENTSFNYDREQWRRSKFLTPGERNIFSDAPQSERVYIDKKIYKDTWAEFRVRVNDKDSEEVKVKWEFGDGKKSYKKETRHKYEETGKYSVKLTLSDESEDVVEEFKIEVKKYPERKVKIRTVSANPAGRDSENEWIRVVNYSKKDVNLKGWSVATGTSSKKVTNHPINDDIIVEKGEEYILTREDSKFSLNNKKGRVELRYPNGDVAYKVKYEKETGVTEDELYLKEDGGNWHWELPVQISEEDEQEDVWEDMPSELMGKQSKWEKGKNDLLESFSGYLSHSEMELKDGSLIKRQGDEYRFVSRGIEREHYSLSFTRKLLLDINKRLSQATSR